MKYLDPTGLWTDNSDGSFTAQKGDTLWDLSRKTGCSIDSFDYKGNPKELQIGQKVSSENLVARYKIANMAESCEGSDDWSYSTAKDNFGKNTYKCNKFVYDVTNDCDASIGTPNGNILKKIFGKTDCPPTAGQLGDPNYSIDNWTPLMDGEIPMPGDIISESHDYSDATGHCGIITGEQKTASSNALLNGKITINNWGFRTDNHPVIRRYRGK
ncbi:MAG: LysM peptidoglycan-binding domain-containing protein [Clostridia bacterium]|nr:LysM peptidoglycan-binding domain-containing protein [Clostridia bacterium]